MLGQCINPCSQKSIPVIQYDAIERSPVVIAINLRNVERSYEIGNIVPRKMRETIHKFITIETPFSNALRRYRARIALIPTSRLSFEI